MKETFIKRSFRLDSLGTIQVVNNILDRYDAQGLKLSLRQLYYQLVVINAVPNTEKSYKKLGGLVSDGRLAGLIDWDLIEDRIRVPRVPTQYRDIEELVNSALYWYRLPRWEGQSHYVELWIEKDALSGVLAPLASEYHVTLMVNRGYSSQSAMKEAAERFRRWVDRDCKLFYLGDHDPSGEDMVRDVADRLETFGVSVEVQKIALTMEQVRQYNPPPNPAKMSDSRAEAYVSKHGAQSWEVDALPPDVLNRMVRTAIEGTLDKEMMGRVKTREEEDKKALRRSVEGIRRRGTH